EETKAGLAGRNDKIEAMTASTELCRLASAALDSYLFGVDDVATSDDDIKQAERAAAEARKRYKAGELDRLSATLAEARARSAIHCRQDHARGLLRLRPGDGAGGPRSLGPDPGAVSPDRSSRADRRQAPALPVQGPLPGEVIRSGAKPGIDRAPRGAWLR